MTDRYDEALARYRERLEPPGPRVKRAVMAALADRGHGAKGQSWLRWFFRPHLVQVRPLLAAAVLVLVAGLGAVVAILATQRGGGNPVATMPAGAVLVRFELTAPDAGQVALAGSFNGWSDTSTFFTQDAETGVWSVTVPLAPGEHEYLFVIDGDRWIPDPEAHALVDDGFGNLNSMLVVGPRGVVRS